MVRAINIKGPKDAFPSGLRIIGPVYCPARKCKSNYTYIVYARLRPNRFALFLYVPGNLFRSPVVGPVTVRSWEMINC